MATRTEQRPTIPAPALPPYLSMDAEARMLALHEQIESFRTGMRGTGDCRFSTVNGERVLVVTL